jgi:isopentenyl-diphosphate delta-isomerase
LKRVRYYRYRFVKDGVMENEICPIWVGYSEDVPRPIAGEAEAADWVDLSDSRKWVKKHPERYSPWSAEEVELLVKSPHFSTWLQKRGLQDRVKLA